MPLLVATYSQQMSSPQDRLFLQEAAARAFAAERTRLEKCKFMEPVRARDVGTSRDFRAPQPAPSAGPELQTSSAGSPAPKSTPGSDASQAATEESLFVGDHDGDQSELGGAAVQPGQQEEELEEAAPGQPSAHGEDEANAQDAVIAAVQGLAIGNES